MVRRGRNRDGHGRDQRCGPRARGGEEAIACPLLEGVDLRRRGVLVNITSRTLKMRETREIIETIRSYASDDATT